jgi:hypothetical protein
MKDRYLNYEQVLNRLLDQYQEHGNLIIAFDFDNTVFDYENDGDTFPKLEKLLRFLKSLGFHLMLYTGNEGKRLEEIVKYCKKRRYEPNYVNENPLMKTRKPFWNILLDDRAGLKETYKTVIDFLNILGYEYRE